MISFPSAITEEIKAIEEEVNECFSCDLPIDPKKIIRLGELRLARLKELVATHDQRLEMMKNETRKMTEKLLGLDLSLKPEIKQKLFEEQDKYDKAAVEWVNDPTLSLWGESEAASIAAGIMILANEVR
jgi:hypothetical protein